MGFSGAGGDPGFDDLVARLESIDYYNELFAFVYGDADVTENRIQLALAQFVRSIQSFDSRYDEGRSRVPNDESPFPNFTPRENMGKQLFLTPPQFGADGVRVGGGLGCGACHGAPEFDIDPNTLSNGAFATISGIGNEFTVTRAPSLRDVVNRDGGSNGGFFHTGLVELAAVVEHYNNIQLAPNLDSRLAPGGQPQNLALTDVERNAVVSFLKTLSGNAVYTDEKWSDPFAEAQD
jgi:cytochrome c peroxidase